MLKAKALVKNKTAILELIYFVVLAGVAVVTPLFPLQSVTGPIVNATIFIAVVILGLQRAILVCVLPSLIALSVGLLPAVLAPMVPFIMLSNMILAAIFNGLSKKNYWLGVGAASLVKFVFLFASSSLVINLIIKKAVATKVATMMSWPQLLTALAGGVLAYLFLKAIKKA